MVPRVLVVDDDPAALEGLRALLAAWGYDVETAPDGRAALEKVTAMHPTAVITDLAMPSMSGLELLNALHDQDPELPVILLSAHRHANPQADGRRHGAYAYLKKPVEVSMLKTVLASTLTADGRSSRPS
jgi:CheY-like chemotaxis protein